MLHESNLSSFLDEKNKFILHFFEGQKLIHDLAIINNLKGKGFSFFRDAVLMFQPMIAFLKAEEGFGFYIDSKDPYFRLKIETNSLGNIRTLLIPENFDEFPDIITGISRLTKISGTKGVNQYTTLIELNSISLNEIANKILKDSYQVEAKIIVSQTSDQSLLILKLPHRKDSMNLADYGKEKKSSIDDLFKKAFTTKDEIKTAMEKLGLVFLGDKEVKFRCACSRERMLDGIRALINSGTTQESLFEAGKDTFEANCDYCKTAYLITKDDLS
ncbi:MAG: hypothetical protein DRQ88_12115 [Epsilonproteobacteria bacterium]|nr:MAG: hypothetical protein DRQ88_12115 [Campylobacterota bacterium]RLA64702.1 MAG: hypothetical protein DRQ89_03305 [Campylobacterota bacterium]